MAMWVSENRGASWTRTNNLAGGSPRNHSYARRLVEAREDFYAFQADGNPDVEWDSRVYFVDRSGEKVRCLPPDMDGDFATPGFGCRAAAGEGRGDRQVSCRYVDMARPRSAPRARALSWLTSTPRASA